MFMKQKYLCPTMHVVELSVEHLLASSVEDMPVKPDVPAVPASYEEELSSETSNWEHKW